MVQSIPSTVIMHALLSNPSAASFPWGGHGLGSDMSRSVLVSEINSRPSVEHDIVLAGGQKINCRNKIFS